MAKIFYRKPKENKTFRKPKKVKKILITILSIILIILLSVVSLGYLQFKKIDHVNLPKTDEGLGISNQSQVIKDENGVDQKKHEVTNILLLGVDKQENASDSIMVMTIDDTSKTIKISSIMRDSYIEFGQGKVNKINYAYHYGGPELSVKTINENYNLDIKNVIKVDFEGLDEIVNSVGGVDIDINADEIKVINTQVEALAKKENVQAKYIQNPGKQRLDGLQALAYSRIRSVGNHDYQRTQRQRNVIRAIFQRMKDMPVSQYPAALSKIAPYFETSLNLKEMLSLGKKAIDYSENGIKETRVPYDEYQTPTNIDGTFYLKWDKEKNLEKLHEFIYLQ